MSEDPTAHLKGRSAAFYRLLTEGLPDGSPITDEERRLAEDAYRRIGRALEAEVFGDREQVEGSPSDDLQDPGYETTPG